MNHAITVCDPLLMWPAVAIGGCIGVVVVCLIALSIFADDWRH